MEGSINGGTPIVGWFIMGKKHLKWMISGCPYFRKPLYLLGGLVAIFSHRVGNFIIPTDGPYLSEGWPNHQPDMRCDA